MCAYGPDKTDIVPVITMTYPGGLPCPTPGRPVPRQVKAFYH